MRVKDVMTTELSSVKVNNSARTASRLIFGKGINGLPVVNDKNCLVGFVSERDILFQFYPSIDEYITDPIHSKDFEDRESEIKSILTMRIDKIMSKNPVSVNANTPLLKAQSIMFAHKVGRLPVINSNKKLIGMITKRDIFTALVGDRLSREEDEEFNDWLSKSYPFIVNWKKRLISETPELTRILKKHGVSVIFDIGCGYGEHDIELATRGYKVYGFERSKYMINDSNKKRRELSKSYRNSVSFYSGEYEKTMKNIKEQPQAALFLGGALAFNPKHPDKTIRIASNILSQKAVMIFQVPNFKRLVEKKNRLNDFSFIQSSSNLQYATLEFYSQPFNRNKQIQRTLSVFVETPGHAWRFFGIKNTIMANITKEWLDQQLNICGFNKISYYGGEYNPQNWKKMFKDPFDQLNSDWLNVVAVRS